MSDVCLRLAFIPPWLFPLLRARCARGVLVPWDVHRRVFRDFVSADGGNTQRLRLCVSSNLLRGATDQTRECSPSVPRTA